MRPITPRCRHSGQPTVVLAKTVKGYGMGTSGEAQNITHQQKKMDQQSIKQFRDRFAVPVPDEQLDEIPYYHPGPDSPEVKYMLGRREALGGPLPERRSTVQPLPVPELEAFESLLSSTGEREISSTMAFVRALAIILRGQNPQGTGGADRGRRGPHLRHGRHVPPAGYLCVQGSAV